jgi:hypothetical protein
MPFLATRSSKQQLSKGPPKGQSKFPALSLALFPFTNILALCEQKYKTAKRGNLKKSLEQSVVS